MNLTLTDKTIGLAHVTLSQQPLDGTMGIKIYEVGKGRSGKQHRLMWLWHTEEAKERGETKERCHLNFKWLHVRPILIRDDEDGKFTELCLIAEGHPGAQEIICNMIRTSEDWLNTKQMSEALDEYDKRQARNGVVFPHPSDLMMAM